DPRLEPIAPTVLFGQLPLVPTLLGRLGDSLFPQWNPAGQWGSLLILIGYGVLALTLGMRPDVPLGRCAGWPRRLPRAAAVPSCPRWWRRCSFAP
ncbi:MAG: hypothetical protein ACKO28_06445, partial [Cyanobium sp.]